MMTLFIILTVAMLAGASLAIVLTDKAQQGGHDDNGGRFYVLMTIVLCSVYTYQNIFLRMYS